MKLIINVIIGALLISCKENKQELTALKPTTEMEKILTNFVKVNKCDGCQYEIYVDKIDPHNYTTTIFVGDHSLTHEENISLPSESLIKKVA